MKKAEILENIKLMEELIADPETTKETKEEFKQTLKELKDELAKLDTKKEKPAKAKKEKKASPVKNKTAKAKTPKIPEAKKLSEKEVEECRDYWKNKLADAKARKQRKEKREKQGKPEELTATEKTQKTVKSVEKKLEEKDEKGKSVKKDISGIINNFKELIKVLKEDYKDQIDEKAVKGLINELSKLIGLKKKFEKGGGIEGMEDYIDGLQHKHQIMVVYPQTYEPLSEYFNNEIFDELGKIRSQDTEQFLDALNKKVDSMTTAELMSVVQNEIVDEF